MTTRPRLLLATDLDGTLLRPDGTVGPTMRAALRAARDDDIEVVFVTGRPALFLPPVLAETGHQGTVLGANGAVTFDAAERRVTALRTFANESVLEIVQALERVPGAADVRVMLHQPDQPDHPGIRLWGDFRTVTTDTAQKLDAGWVCIKIAAGGAAPHTSESFAAKSLSTIVEECGPATTVAELTWSMSTPALVELSPPGVHKGSALVGYAQSQDVAPADIHAVGDMPNDLPMLAAAGRAYAVGNAHPAVLAAAHEHLPSNEHDAVAVLISQLLAQPRASETSPG